MRTKRYLQLAQQIMSRLAADRQYLPPPVHELASQMRVSTLTVWKAYGVLKGKGLIVGSQGKRMRRTDTLDGRTVGAPDATEVFAARVRDSIREGIFRTGERLPKYESLIADSRVSPATVALALARLASEGLIHKKGRNWIVGPRRAAPLTPAAASEARPVVLLLLTDPHQNVFHNVYMMPFLHTLETELRASDIILRVGHRVQSESGRSPVPCQGMEQVEDAIEAWGDNYRGAVIVDQHADIDTYCRWADFLSSRGTRPVVYFDQNNENAGFARSELSFGATFYRLYFDELSAIQLALRALSQAGHRIVGLPPIVLRKPESWATRRISLIEKQARAMSPRLEIIVSPSAEPFWDTGISANDPARAQDLYEAFLRHVAAEGESSPVRRTPSAEDVLRHTPSLTTLLRKSATALISLNDWGAHQHYFWCHAAGVRIPDDLSMISFDNDPITRIYPINSIDFGFGGLGYLAARILCGATPGETDRTGGIPGTCALVNRGSVGAPNTGTAARVRAIVGT